MLDCSRIQISMRRCNNCTIFSRWFYQTIVVNHFFHLVPRESAFYGPEIAVVRQGEAERSHNTMFLSQVEVIVSLCTNCDMSGENFHICWRLRQNVAREVTLTFHIYIIVIMNLKYVTRVFSESNQSFKLYCRH